MALTVKLADKLIRDARPGMTADDDGLYLKIGPTGAASWALRYQLAGRRRVMGLGACASLTLAEARDKASEARKLIREGIDPIEAKKATENAEIAARVTFRDEAVAYIEAHRAGWKNAKHTQQWLNTLTTYAFPTIGNKTPAEVSTADVLEILQPVWSVKPETASRVRNRIELILDACKAKGLRDGENPARLRGHLDKLLPRIPKAKRVQHHAALPWSEVPRFMRELRARDGMATRALELAILCASRYGEVANATWREFDLDQNVWTIPGTRMKASPKGHRVPLSPRAVEIIQGLSRGEPDDLLFPSRTGTPLSDSALTAVIDRLHEADIKAKGKGFTDPKSGRVATQHGFRSTFRDWVLEETLFAEGLAELALAHVTKDRAEAAYRRGDALEKRRALMIEWAKFCANSSTPANVITLRSATA